MLESLAPLDAFLAHGWSLHAWRYRYDAGAGELFAALAPYPRHLETLEGLSNSGDVEACAFTEYLLNAGRWLPIARGLGLRAALIALADHLAPVVQAQRHRDPRWKEAVDRAYDTLNHAADGADGIARAIDHGELLTDPFTAR